MKCFSKICVTIVLFTGVIMALSPKHKSHITKPVKSGFGIIGGRNVKIQKYSFMVALIIAKMDDRFAEDFQFCGGTVIADRWVLTAGHCLNNLKLIFQVNKSDWFVRAGHTIWNSFNFTDPDRKDYQVDDYYIHDKYHQKVFFDINFSEYNRYFFDIGLIRVVGRFHSYRYDTLYLSGTYYNYKMNSNCTVIGYGLSDTPEILGRDTHLQELNTKIISRPKCREIYAKVGLDVDNAKVCSASPFGEGLCFYDDGGPLLQQGIVIGIISYVSGCGHTELPAVYTRLSLHKYWIKKYVNITRFAN